jgi:IS66 C-terminal element
MIPVVDFQLLPDMGNHRHASADREDERCRSARLAHTNPRTDRAGLADLSDRCSHALALQSLNGLSLALTTLLQTAKMNDVDPHAWLTQTLERIAQGWPISQIDALMPWHFKA